MTTSQQWPIDCGVRTTCVIASRSGARDARSTYFFATSPSARCRGTLRRARAGSAALGLGLWLAAATGTAPRADACGPEKEPPHAGAGLAAAIAPPSLEHAEVTAAFDELAGWFPATRGWFALVKDLHFVRVRGGLAPDWSTLHHPKVVRADSLGQRLTPVAPLHADGPFRVALEGRPGLWLELTPLGLPPVEVHVSRGLLVYPGAVEGGDLFYKLTPTHVDEYVRLHDEIPSLTLRYAISAGPEVGGLRETDRSIEVIDRDGATRLRINRPFARAVDGTRRDGRVTLEHDVLVATIDLVGLAFPVLVDPDWETAGFLTAERFLHHSLLLQDGSVLVPGGCRFGHCPIGIDHPACSTEVSDVDRYDPVSGTWSSVASMLGPRFAYAGVVLPDGDVLVAGGCSLGYCAAVTSAAERYSPVADAWSAAGDLSAPRAYATAARLADGRVIVAGGCDPAGCSPVTDIYDPVSGTWAAGPSLGEGRGMHTLTALADGRMLAIGGCADLYCADLIASGEILDPEATAWTPAGTLVRARAAHAATELCDGSVLVTGGCIASSCTAATAYTERWVDGAGEPAFGGATGMLVSRHHHTATLLGDNTVLVVGGCFMDIECTESAELFDPATGTWTGVDDMPVNRGFHSATRLADGRVMVAGGCNDATCMSFVHHYVGAGTGAASRVDAGPGAGACSIAGDADVPANDAGLDPDGGFRPPIDPPGGCRCALSRPASRASTPVLLLALVALVAALRRRLR